MIIFCCFLIESTQILHKNQKNSENTLNVFCEVQKTTSEKAIVS